MPATLKDIAKQVGVSVSTVSYALNGGPRTVGTDVKDKILAAAKALDYRPNTVAKSLITRRTRTIGLIPTEASLNITRGPYFQGCLEGIVNEAEVQEQDVLLYTRYDQAESDRFLSTILDGRADGVIFLAPKVKSPVVDWLEGRLPAIVVSSKRFSATPTLSVDNHSGVRLVIDHLRSLGHTKIGHLYGSVEVDDGLERMDAYCSIMENAGLPVNKRWLLNGMFTPEGGYIAGKKLLSERERPTAVFCANDESALGLMRAAGEFGVRVPEDLSVVGFDDAPTASFSIPQLTSVRQPLDTIGATALRNLVSLVEGNSVPGHQKFATELVIRKSTTSPREDL